MATSRQAEPAGRVTYYGVQAFTKKGARLVADQPVTASNEGAARRLAQSLGVRRGGAVAFSRTGDKETGEYDDPVILEEVGTVPAQDGF